MGIREKQVAELLASGAFDGVEVGSMEGYETQKTGSAVREYLSLNVAIAMEHMVLRAVDLGLGTCWIGRFNPKKVREIIGLPDNIYVVMLLSVGHPAQSPPPRSRFPIEQLVIKTL